ncbi:MAG: hypothetical protein EOO37_05500, partial [Cytophagaceae bacterium]
MAAPAWAQLDNRAFTESKTPLEKYSRDEEAFFTRVGEIPVGYDESKKIEQDSVSAALVRKPLYLQFKSFTFFKDNEYFNEIVEGYTLFGTQLNPQLVYYPTKDLRLEAGVFLWKDFGNPQLRQVRPTFRGTWTVGDNQLIFGNILPNLNHGYIEPLLDFERVILKPLEEGLQYRRTSKHVFLDVWVDWLKQEYP